jgi:predicted permease
MDFVTSLINVGLLIALAMPGYILGRLKMVKGEAIDALVNILLYVACPFLSIMSFTRTEFSSTLLINMASVILFAFFLLIGSYYVSTLLFRGIKESPVKKVCVACGYMNNCAFMGIPVVQTFFPNQSEPLIYVSMFGIAFNILSWTLLVFTITGEKKYVRLKAAFLNPGMAALLVSIPLLVFDINPPPVLDNILSSLANMTTPLAMIIVGVRLSEIKLRELFTSSQVYMSAAVKLVVIPLISLPVIILGKQFLPITSTVTLTLYIVMAMPSASFVIIFSEKFNGDRLTAVKCVLLSSVMSIVTIPLLMLLSPLLLGP